MIYVSVINNGASTVYVGGDDVTTSNGFPVVSGSTQWFALTDLDVLYAVVASGSVDIFLLVQPH